MSKYTKPVDRWDAIAAAERAARRTQADRYVYATPKGYVVSENRPGIDTEHAHIMVGPISGEVITRWVQVVPA